MDFASVERATEVEVDRGSALMENGVDALKELQYLLKKFKLYRNSKKFNKVISSHMLLYSLPSGIGLMNIFSCPTLR